MFCVHERFKGKVAFMPLSRACVNCEPWCWIVVCRAPIISRSLTANRPVRQGGSLLGILSVGERTWWEFLLCWWSSALAQGIQKRRRRLPRVPELRVS